MMPSALAVLRLITNSNFVGCSTGRSLGFARQLARDGYTVALAARDTAELAAFATEIGASVHACDAADPASVDRLFAEVDRAFPKLYVCLFNASARAPGPRTVRKRGMLC